MPSLDQQITMFGVSSNPEVRFNIYHDESGTYNPPHGDRWLLHGVLFLPDRCQREFCDALLDIRQSTGYYNEVHYVNLRKSITGPKARCSRSWLNTYFYLFYKTCYYHCLAIDTHSPGFKHSNFSEPYLVYNYFAHVAFVGGIAWSLNRYRRVALKLFSDSKCRKSSDNFTTYLPNAIIKNIAEKRLRNSSKYPEINLLHPEVISVNSDPKQVPENMKQECELIQLVDLLTANIAQAVTMRSTQQAKIVLSEIIAICIEDAQKPPWLQTKNLHRCFSVSFFPDEKGEFFTPTLAVKDRNQLSLF